MIPKSGANGSRWGRFRCVAVALARLSARPLLASFFGVVLLAPIILLLRWALPGVAFLEDAILVIAISALAFGAVGLKQSISGLNSIRKDRSITFLEFGMLSKEEIEHWQDTQQKELHCKRP